MQLVQYRTPEFATKSGLVQGDSIIPIESESTLFGLAQQAQAANSDLFSYVNSLSATQRNKGRLGYLDLMIDARVMVPFHQPDTLRHTLALLSPQPSGAWHWSYLGDASQLTFPFWPLRPLNAQDGLGCAAALAACYYIDNERKPRLVGLANGQALTAQPERKDGFDHLQICTYGPELSAAQPWLEQAATDKVKGQISLRHHDGSTTSQAFACPVPDIDSAAAFYFSRPWFTQRGHVHILLFPLHAPLPQTARAGDSLEIQIQGLGRALVSAIRAA